MDELSDEMRRTYQRLASLEQDARQPRLAMGVDVPADKKTRERTEGAATAVQAMHGDSCTTKGVQAGPTTSTSFGVKVEPPAIPGMTWSRTALRRQSRISYPWRCAPQYPSVAYSPPAKPLERRGLSFISRVLGSAQLKRRILRGHQHDTPCTAAVSGGASFLPPPGGGLYKQNEGKLWYSIQAVPKSSPRLPVFGNVAHVALWGGSR